MAPRHPSSQGLPQTPINPHQVLEEGERASWKSPRKARLWKSSSPFRNMRPMVNLKPVDTFHLAGKSILGLVSNKYSWFLPVENIVFMALGLELFMILKLWSL